MEQTIEIIANYGCLAAEKRTIYTYGGPAETAKHSETLTVVVPDDWKLCKNKYDEVMVEAPWGEIYGINELLVGNKQPRFEAYDKEYNLHTAMLNPPKDKAPRVWVYVGQ